MTLKQMMGRRAARLIALLRERADLAGQVAAAKDRILDLEAKLAAKPPAPICCPSGNGAWFGPCADGFNHRPWCDVAIMAGSGVERSVQAIVAGVMRDAVSPPRLDRYPHCDQFVLHDPGACEFCAMPEFALLQAWRDRHFVNRTGENNPAKQPCPAQVLRSQDTIEKWHGNRADRLPKEKGTSGEAAPEKVRPAVDPCEGNRGPEWQAVPGLSTEG